MPNDQVDRARRAAPNRESKSQVKERSARAPVQRIVRRPVERTIHRSRMYRPSNPSNSKYASLPAMHDIRVPASAPTVSRSASDKGISRPSIAEMSDITWQVSGAPLRLSSVSIDCADCWFGGIGFAKRGSRSWQWLKPLVSFVRPRLDSSSDSIWRAYPER